MNLPMPLEELAELAGVPPEEMEALREGGYIDPDGDGLCDPADVLRLMFLWTRGDGVSVEDRIKELEQQPSPLLSRLLGPGLRHHKIPDVLRELDIDSDIFQAMTAAVGSGKSSLDDFDVEALRAIRQLVASGFPPESLYEGTRVYSDALRRLTDAEISMTHRYLCGPMREGGAGEADIAVALGDVSRMIEPLADRLVEDTLHDHRSRAIAHHVLDHLEAARRGSSMKTLEATMVFADLAVFTTITEAEGDEAAAMLLDRFDRVVRTAAMRRGGSLVKQIGDAFMLAFAEPEPAVRFALDVSEEATNLGSVRIGIHHGPVLHRVGDYVGHTVNVASRVASMAMPETILVTEPVAKAAVDAGIEVEPVGVRRARGVDEPIALYRIVAADLRTDPVCGKPVGDAAARVKHEGTEVVFCSSDCLRRFLDDPASYPPRA